MPRASDPRVVVRFSEQDYADVARAAEVAGVPVAAMVRVCAVNWCAFVAAEKHAFGRDWGFRRRANRPRPFVLVVEQETRRTEAHTVWCGADPRQECSDVEGCLKKGCAAVPR